MKFLKNKSLSGFSDLRGRTITGNKVRLREKKPEDVRDDYRWQSDPELARLDAAPPLAMSFHISLVDYSEEMQRPRNNRFPLAIETLDGKHIGNCTFYDIDEKKGEAQLGIMIGDRDYWDKDYGRDAVCAMVDYAFSKAGINRLYLKTLDWNLRAQNCFARCGFNLLGHMRRNGYDFTLMELKREQWEKGLGEKR
jgi:[ribosomal protein S5]-alanine N-acetyltransferase